MIIAIVRVQVPSRAFTRRDPGEALDESAEMAELADAHGSGPCDSNVMRVQVPFSALCNDVAS